MELTTVTYQGPALSSMALLESLPADYAKLLRQINGFIQFGGGLHIRGLFQLDGGKLEPGQLLSAYSPFCTQEAVNGVSLKAVDLFDRLKFLADFSAQINGLSDGTSIKIELS